MSDQTKLKLLALLGFLALLLTLSYPSLLQEFAHRSPRIDHTNLPPAFSGNRFAYGWALFSMFLMSTLSIRKMLIIGLEFKEQPWRDAPDISLYRAAIFSFCTMVVIGVSPDVALMLLWGEAQPSTLVTWMTLDRVGDGLSGMAFLVGITLVVRAEQVSRIPPAILLPSPSFFEIVPRRENMSDHVRILASVGAIALGLALWK